MSTIGSNNFISKRIILIIQTGFEAQVNTHESVTKNNVLTFYKTYS